MKKGWKIFIGVLAGVIVITAVFIPIIINEIWKEDSSYNSILVLNDEDFLDYHLLGTGTENDPYIFEKLTINSYDADSAIHISGTSKYFIIRDCVLQAPVNGIKIKAIAAGTANITRNICSGLRYGISLDDADYSTITNNTFNNLLIGIEMFNSVYSSLINNTFINNNDCGILSYSSHESFLSGNIFYNCGLKGFIEEEFANYTILNNLVNGKKLGFLKNEHDLIIESSIYGQLYLINCSNMVISNQDVSNATTGFVISICNNITLRDNICNNNSNYGSKILNSPSITLINNTITYCSFGIMSYYSPNGTLIDNTCSFNNDGILLHFSPNTTIINNICSNNEQGIALYYSSNVSIKSNLISYNNLGIWFFYHLNINYSIITSNSFILNTGYAIYLESGLYNIIYRNNFIDNNLNGASQGFDNGLDNNWYNTSINQGNYWNDWISGEYPIDGSADATDPYPLDSPIII